MNNLKSDHITNPFRRKRKKDVGKMSQIDFKDIFGSDKKYSDIPVSEWKPKEFVFWFSDCLSKNYPNLPKYNIVYKNDCKVMSMLKNMFNEAGLNNKHLKNFIKYVIENEVGQVMEQKRQSGKLVGFTTNDLLNFVNNYIQQTVMLGDAPHLKTRHNPIPKQEISECLEKGGIVVSLRNYGIPITATYIFNNSKDDNDKYQKIVNIIDRALSKANEKTLENIAKQSALRGPYDDNFKLTDWRNTFKKHWNKIEAYNNPWWDAR